jgi:monoamine oxidase
MGVARAGGYGAAFAAMHAIGLLIPPAAIAEPFELPPGVGKNTKIIILGAGISGLVAAYEMRKAGFDCTVLEARERPGGRNWTIRTGTQVEFIDGTLQKCTFEPGNYFNAGPARLPSIHKAMLGYCKELGVPLEIEINTNRSALLQSSKAFGGKPIEMREAVNDTRGQVSALLAKAIQQGALDQEITVEDRERMLVFLRKYGDLDPSYAYRGSWRAGVTRFAGAGDEVESDRNPLPMHALLDASFWTGMMFEEEFDQQATMFQPEGGMDRIPYAFAQKLGNTVKYNSPVKEIRKTPNGVRVVWSEGAGGPTQSMEAAYCLCCLPLTILRNTPNDFSPRVTAALASVVYDSAYKIAWESRRFWEQENNIYGGISWISDGPIGLVWYPSGGMFSQKGVLVSGYAVEGESEFDELSTTKAKMSASRAAIEKLHPGRGGELAKPIYMCWGKIPYNLGSWVSGFGNAGGYFEGPYREFIVPDDRIYFAGDHCSRLAGWQEGAALSAQRSINMIVQRMRQS